MSIFSLTWFPSVPSPPSLPPSIHCTFIQTPSGSLELLHSTPSTSSSASRSRPILFAHGGFGSAAVWLEYMVFFASHNIPVYAVSYRGHGQSYRPSFLCMVYGTTRGMLADDLLAALRYVEEAEGREGEVVLVGHSSGGGLAQWILSERGVKIGALGLLGSVPGFGSMGVYTNWWFKVDPMFSLRLLWHGWHPGSPLSSTRLVKNVFFSEKKPTAEVTAFQKLMAPFESFWWPIVMMWKFAEPERVIKSITGWGNGSRILVMGGDNDRICSPDIMARLAFFYRSTRLSIAAESSPDDGVDFILVPGGHHFQNDVSWEYGAGKLLHFYKKL